MYMEKRGIVVLPEENLKVLAAKIAEGLKYLHAKGIVHRDMKPENILMSDTSDTCTPIITDFGYASQLKEGETCSKLCGTKKYLAPEVLE